MARHVGLPPFDHRLKFQKRALFRRSDRPQQVSSSSSCRRNLSAVFSILERVLPRKSDNVICLVTRKKPPVLYASAGANLQVVSQSAGIQDRRGSSRFPSLVQLATPTLLGHPDHTSGEWLRLLRPLLKILLFTINFLRTTKACHVDETRSVLPNLSCRKIVDDTYKQDLIDQQREVST